jgi:hypothetical protein
MATKESEAEADPLRDPDPAELEAQTLEGERGEQGASDESRDRGEKEVSEGQRRA